MRQRTNPESNVDPHGLLANGDTVTTIRDRNPPSAAAVGCLGILVSFLTVFAVIVCCMTVSYALTDSLTWGYTIEEVKKSIPGSSWLFPPRIFTAEELSKYDGTDPDQPIYVVVTGQVYDATSGARFYDSKGGYNIFAGRDASRSFATGCFDPTPGSKCLEEAKRGIEGLSEKDLREVEHWKKFYSESNTYPFVGYYPTSPSASDEAKQYL